MSAEEHRTPVHTDPPATGHGQSRYSHKRSCHSIQVSFDPWIVTIYTLRAACGGGVRAVGVRVGEEPVYTVT